MYSGSPPARRSAASSGSIPSPAYPNIRWTPQSRNRVITALLVAGQTATAFVVGTVIVFPAQGTTTRSRRRRSPPFTIRQRGNRHTLDVDIDINIRDRQATPGLAQGG